MRPQRHISWRVSWPERQTPRVGFGLLLQNSYVSKGFDQEVQVKCRKGNGKGVGGRRARRMDYTTKRHITTETDSDGAKVVLLEAVEGIYKRSGGACVL